jgi:hypothetical protein
MNPDQCRVLLRERGPLEAFDLALRLIRVRWRPFVRVLIPSLLPLFVFGFVLAWLLDGHPALLALPLVAAGPLQGLFTATTGHVLFADDQDITLREVVGTVTGRLGPALVAWATYGLAVAVSLLSCAVVLPVVQGALLFVTEAALLERVSPGRGLRRSLRLSVADPLVAAAGVVGWWVLTLWCGAVAEAGGLALESVLQVPALFGSAMDGKVTPYLLGGLLAAQPLFAVYRMMLYVAVRTRSEGWDLQVRLRAAGLARS